MSIPERALKVKNMKGTQAAAQYLKRQGYGVIAARIILCL